MNKAYEAAIDRITTMRAKAPEAQQAAINLALTMLRRADATATPAKLAEYRGEQGYALSRVESNDEASSPDMRLAQMIILRTIPA